MSNRRSVMKLTETYTPTREDVQLKREIYNFFDYFEFFKEIVKRDFKKKYYKSFLGIIWTILNPLLMMVVITIVFSTLFKRQIPYFPVYYLIGYIFLSFNNISTSQALNSILSNNGLIKKIYVPQYIFPISCVIIQLITLIISLIPLVLVMLLIHVPFTPYILLLPIPIFYVFLFSTGLSLILSAYGTFLRDLTYLYGIITLIWTYLTPVFYPIEIIPQAFRFFWNLNPLYIYVTIARTLVLDGKLPDPTLLIAGLCFSVLTLITGAVIFREKKKKFILYI